LSLTNFFTDSSALFLIILSLRNFLRDSSYTIQDRFILEKPPRGRNRANPVKRGKAAGQNNPSAPARVNEGLFFMVFIRNNERVFSSRRKS
jgi:hypothetical protein